MVRDIDIEEPHAQTPVERQQQSAAWHKDARSGAYDSHALIGRITNGAVHRIDLLCNLHRMIISIGKGSIRASSTLLVASRVCVSVCVCAVAKVGKHFCFGFVIVIQLAVRS